MQFGFQPNKKTEDALLVVTDCVCEAIDNSQPCISVFLDLAKAFDTVNHELLLQKLNHLGIRGKANGLIKSYLTNRKQIVKINQTCSDELTITCGVPQGTILGPLLFILYINEIFDNNADDTIISFADDTAIIVVGNSWLTVVEKAELIGNKIAYWLARNYLSFNIGKTNYMTHGSYVTSYPERCNIKIHKQNCDNIDCNCTELTRVNKTKYLDIIIDENLKWLEQTNFLISRLRYLIFILYKMEVDTFNKATNNFILCIILVESNLRDHSMGRRS